MFIVQWNQYINDVNTPQSAAMQAYKDISDGESLIFTVKNTDTGEIFEVDLSEPESNCITTVTPDRSYWI